MVRRFANVEEAHEEITIERDEISYVYELRITSLYDRMKQLRCRVLLIHDITWLKDDNIDHADDLAEPEEIAAEIMANLQTAMEEMEALAEILEGEEAAG